MANNPQAAPVRYLARGSGAWDNVAEDGGEDKESFQGREAILTGHTDGAGCGIPEISLRFTITR